MFPTSPYNVSLVSPTSSGWAPSSFTTPQQQQSIGSSASWTHEFKGVPLRCGWYHSGRTAVPSLKSHFFLRGRKTVDPHNSDQVVTKDTKYCHLDNLFLQVHLGVQSLLPSHIFASQPNFAGKVRQLMGGHIICDIRILKGSSQKACHPWSQHHVPCTRCRVNPSFTHKKLS